MSRLVIDQIATSLKERFSDNKQLISDIYFMQPTMFSLLLQVQMSKSALQEVVKMAKVSHDELRSD